MFENYSKSLIWHNCSKMKFLFENQWMSVRINLAWKFKWDIFGDYQTLLNRHVKQAEYKEDERIFERIHYTLHMYMSKKYEYMHQHQPRFCEKKFLIKVVRKNQVQEESWEDEVIIISVRVDMKNMQSWKIFAYRNHPYSFTRNGWWCHLLE